ncbi:MAG TPA: S9 family peptidase [Anaerolineales bacterium]|nr:S9 family peptidase [Anaerolineales bacterium]
MREKAISRQYGLWDSPVSPTGLGRGITFSDVAWDQDGTLVWREVRSGRGVLMVQKPDGQAGRDLNSDLAVRAGVGYGGGDFAVGHGMVYFVEAETGRLYRQTLEHGKARPITPAFGNFAAPAISPDGNWLLFVHSYEGEDSLGIVDSEGRNWPQRLVSGNDFYMQPAWQPRQAQSKAGHIAWIAWDHPNMPWDGTSLYLAELDPGASDPPRIGKAHSIAGDERTSIFQPEFSPDGRRLAYVSDASGWWQIYLYDLRNGEHRRLTEAPADHGLPAWVQGMRSYAFSPDCESIYSLRNDKGFASLWRIDLEDGTEERLPVDEEYTWMEQIAVSPDGARIALLASGSKTPPRVINFGASEGVHIRQRATSEQLAPSQYATTQPIIWQGMDGKTVHGLFSPPHNPGFSSTGRPPLVVHIHGGPTSQRRAAYNPQAQFFASRGYAYLEVNHRGSTGYGREYWEALNGNWGIYDVQDAVSGARHLVDRGEVDGDRLVIMGGSAGGFTVLQALEDYPGFFRAGVCLYGVANQFTLVAETHKFEARYSDSLLGPLPEAAEVYRARSPIFHADKIRDPIAVFQGEDDKVVPRDQSDEIVASLKERGVPYEYHLYPGEGHGFRKTETIEDFYEAVERFLKKYVIFA